MVHHISNSIKLFENNPFIINSNKSKKQAANLPKNEIGNGNDPKNDWSYHRKQQLSIQAQRLSEHQLNNFGQMVKVCSSYIIKIIQFKLVSVVL